MAFINKAVTLEEQGGFEVMRLQEVSLRIGNFTKKGGNSSTYRSRNEGNLQGYANKISFGKFPFPPAKRISKAGIVQIEKVLDQSSRT